MMCERLRAQLLKPDLPGCLDADDGAVSIHANTITIRHSTTQKLIGKLLIDCTAKVRLARKQRYRPGPWVVYAAAPAVAAAAPDGDVYAQ